MNRFLDEILPKGLIEAQERRKTLERTKFDVAMKLDYDEQWSDHTCDCEYCESNDMKQDPLTSSEREELELQFKELDDEIIDLSAGIKRMTDYKEWMEKRSE